MNPKPGSQVKIGRKSKHPATETGVTEMQQTENQDETYPLTDTKQIPKHPATHGHKKIRAAACCLRHGHPCLAEREGFEPPVQLPVHRISSAARSTTPASFLESTQKPSFWDCKYRHYFY